MRSLIAALLVLCAGLAPAVPAWAQQNPPPAPAQPQAPAQPPAPAAAAEPQAPAAPSGVDLTRSLFDVEPNQFEFGARVTSIDGDPARFQRYGDFRDGVLFTAGRFTREGADGAWMCTVPINRLSIFR